MSEPLMARIVYNQNYGPEHLKGKVGHLREHQEELRSRRGGGVYSGYLAFCHLIRDVIDPEEAENFIRKVYNTLYDCVIAQETYGMGSNSNGTKWRDAIVAWEDAY